MSSPFFPEGWKKFQGGFSQSKHSHKQRGVQQSCRRRATRAREKSLFCSARMSNTLEWSSVRGQKSLCHGKVTAVVTGKELAHGQIYRDSKSHPKSNTYHPCCYHSWQQWIDRKVTANLTFRSVKLRCPMALNAERENARDLIGGARSERARNQGRSGIPVTAPNALYVHDGQLCPQ